MPEPIDPPSGRIFGLRPAWLLLAVVWTAGIWFLSARPASSLPQISVPGLDKLVHLALFAGLAFFWTLALGGTRSTAIVAILCTVAYGVIDEWHQGSTPGRDVSVGDAVADALGASVGAMSALLVVRGLRRRAAATAEGPEPAGRDIPPPVGGRGPLYRTRILADRGGTATSMDPPLAETVPPSKIDV